MGNILVDVFAVHTGIKMPESPRITIPETFSVKPIFIPMFTIHLGFGDKTHIESLFVGEYWHCCPIHRLLG
jgi:hypothetical protein